MQDLPENLDSKFRFILLAAHRAEQMMRGARAKIDLPGEKITRVAMQEIFGGHVEWGYGTPEVEEALEQPVVDEGETAAS